MHNKREKTPFFPLARCPCHTQTSPLKGKIFNSEVLAGAGLPSMYTLLRELTIAGLGRRIPKDTLPAELVIYRQQKGLAYLRYRDVCKQDMRPQTWILTIGKGLLTIVSNLSHGEKRIRQFNLLLRQEQEKKPPGTEQTRHQSVPRQYRL